MFEFFVGSLMLVVASVPAFWYLYRQAEKKRKLALQKAHATHRRRQYR